MRPAQILEERLLLRTFFSTISLWVSLLMDKGSSIVKRFSRISGQHQTFAAASDIFRSIFLKRKSALTYTEKWKTNDFSNRKERKRAEVTQQLCAQRFQQGLLQLSVSEGAEFQDSWAALLLLCHHKYQVTMPVLNCPPIRQQQKKSRGSLRSESVSMIPFLPTLPWSAGQASFYLPIPFVLRCFMLPARGQWKSLKWKKSYI